MRGDPRTGALKRERSRRDSNTKQEWKSLRKGRKRLETGARALVRERSYQAEIRAERKATLESC